jgi:hypothetical protein
MACDGKRKVAIASDGIRLHAKGLPGTKRRVGQPFSNAFLMGALDNNPQFKTARLSIRARSPNHLINSWPSMKTASECSVF